MTLIDSWPGFAHCIGLINVRIKLHVIWCWRSIFYFESHQLFYCVPSAQLPVLLDLLCVNVCIVALAEICDQIGSNLQFSLFTAACELCDKSYLVNIQSFLLSMAIYELNSDYFHVTCRKRKSLEKMLISVVLQLPEPQKERIPYVASFYLPNRPMQLLSCSSAQAPLNLPEKGLLCKLDLVGSYSGNDTPPFGCGANLAVSLARMMLMRERLGQTLTCWNFYFQRKRGTEAEVGRSEHSASS